MKQELAAAIVVACHELYAVEVRPDLSRPDEKFGDFATNVVLQLAKQLGHQPRQVGQAIADKLQQHPAVSEVSLAGPGFINIRLHDTPLLTQLTSTGFAQPYAGQTIVAEYSDPNPFKVLHAGHLYTSIVGDAMANLMEAAGGEVHRVNFGGDVGMHVGKTLWAIVEKLGGEKPEQLTAIPSGQRADWMAEAYVRGNAMFEADEQIKAQMVELNKFVYQLHATNDHSSALAQIYWTCREWSYQYFNQFYARIGSQFERYYPESETAELGLETVKQHIGEVFQESDGATVFKGEDYGLHTRVFINSEGLPTYEAKDVGLIMKKWQDYKFDQSVIITGNEQLQYMTVVLKAIEQFAPELAQATRHFTHGIVKLTGGVKMSSRQGNVLRAVDVLDAATVANREATGNNDPQVVLGAVKYAFLRQRLGGDIIYDPAESVALEGNSGPYLQYAHARARSILRKADGQSTEPINDLQPAERSLVRKLTEYGEVVDQAVADLMPHHICTYLYGLSQSFNRFYEHNRVIGDAREAERLHLVTHYADTLQSGLMLLGIQAPDKM